MISDTDKLSCMCAFSKRSKNESLDFRLFKIKFNAKIKSIDNYQTRSCKTHQPANAFVNSDGVAVIDGKHTLDLHIHVCSIGFFSSHLLFCSSFYTPNTVYMIGNKLLKCLKPKV